MRISFVGGINVPAQGGIESYSFNLSKQLLAKGHEPWIICRGEEDKESFIDGIRITQLKCKENPLSILIHNLHASLFLCKKGNRVDVVNYQSIYLPFLYEWIPKLHGIKVCHTQHSFAQDNPKHGKISLLFIGFIYWLSSFIFSPIITVSEHNRRLIKKRLKKDATIINCGVQINPIYSQSNVLNKFNIIDNNYYLSIGRIDPVKNLDVLIKAFLKHPKDNNLQLVLCGNENNSYGNYLKQIVGNDHRVIFTGPVFGDDKNTLLEHALAYCLVSTSEGFPIALLEAMSFGKACLCSDIPANREALTVELGIWSKVKNVDSLYESMLCLEKEPDRYSRLGELARKRIENEFTWDIIADKYINFLKSHFEFLR